MSGMKNLTLLLLVSGLVIVNGCSKSNNNPAGSGEGSNVVTPTITLNDNTHYQVSSICIGQSGSHSTYIYGIVKFKYLGTGDVKYVEVAANFKNSQGTVLFSDDSYIRNLTDCFDGYAYNTNTFLTASHDTGYYYIIKDFDGHTASEIASVDLTITSEDYAYAPPMGLLTKTESPYTESGNQWCQKVINSGNQIVTATYTRFVFRDSQNKLFMWTFPDSYISDVLHSTYQVGQTGYFKSDDMTPNYMSSSLTLADACVDWDTSGVASSRISLLKSGTPDQNNLLLRQERDRATKECKLKSMK